MLFLLRQIRRKLLTDNKITTYLLYAVGEIFLVVVGILIAISIDDWRESSTDALRRQDLLKNLTNEFVVNQLQMESVLRMDQNAEKAILHLLSIIKSKSEVGKDSIESLVAMMSQNHTFDPHDGVLNAAISSGDIRLLQNDSLINLLYAWTSAVKDSDEEERRMREDYDKFVWPFTHTYIYEADLLKHFLTGSEPSSAYASDYQGMVFDKQFENLMVKRLELIIDVIDELKGIASSTEQIVALLRDEHRKDLKKN